jgi:hypothetical protein
MLMRQCPIQGMMHSDMQAHVSSKHIDDADSGLKKSGSSGTLLLRTYKP